MRRTWAVFPLFVATALVARSAIEAQETGPATRPKLVVLLVIDQMRTDYLENPRVPWRAGFRRLLSEGAWFEHGEYPYMNTVTCAGHTTIGTGTYPRTHGMTLNGWWDRTRRASVTCNDDPDSPVLPYREARPPAPGAKTAPEASTATNDSGDAPNPPAQPSPTAPSTPGAKPAPPPPPAPKTGTSAKMMLAPTLADELRAQLPGARVVTMSLKARSAIGLAGHAGTSVTWIDDTAAAFSTSRAFAPALVPEMAEFLKRDPYTADVGKTWTLRDPANTYRYADATLGARPSTSRTGLFPHRVAGTTKGPDAQFFTLWQTSPHSDAYLVRMAKAMVDAYGLGQRQGTDFLGVSLSALDLVGHGFGPESREVEDMVRRLDDTVGALFDHLDEKVGRGNWVLGFSSDHGVAPTAITSGGGRITTEDVRERIEETLINRWGPRKDVEKEGNYVASVTFNYVYLGVGVFDRLKTDAAAYAEVEKAALSVPGMVRVLRSDRLSETSSDRDVKSAALSWAPGRSGDLILVGKPNWYFGPRGDGAGTTHGTANLYDRRVPVILLGPAIKPGKYSQAASPADLAPTLAQIIGVKMPKAEGRVLKEAIK